MYTFHICIFIIPLMKVTKAREQFELSRVVAVSIECQTSILEKSFFDTFRTAASNETRQAEKVHVDHISSYFLQS